MSQVASEAVQRILVWCGLGCRLARQAGRWCLVRPATMTGSRGPAPKSISDRTARAALDAGAPTERGDLFGDQGGRAS